MNNPSKDGVQRVFEGDILRAIVDSSEYLVKKNTLYKVTSVNQGSRCAIANLALLLDPNDRVTISIWADDFSTNHQGQKFELI